MVLIPLLVFFVIGIAVLVAAVTADRDQATRPWRRLERALTWLAIALGAVAASALLVVPIYATITESSSPGFQVTKRRGETLLGVNGFEVLPVLLLPVVLTSIPLFRGTPHERRVRAAMVALLLVGFTILGGFSIGLFYVPSALVMLAAATLGVVIERTA